MTDQAQAVIATEVARDERLLWVGQPRGGIRFTAADIFLVPFSVMWCGFVVFAGADVWRRETPSFISLWFSMFLVAGLYFVFGRFVYDAIRRSKTFYGVTDHRVIIVASLFGRSTTSMEIASLPEITISERSDRSGTISLGAASNRWSSMMASRSMPGSARHLPPALEMIEGAREVYETIRDLRGKKHDGLLA